jgi:hypothetical protein
MISRNPVGRVRGVFHLDAVPALAGVIGAIAAVRVLYQCYL